jgi:hypothetical protein
MDNMHSEKFMIRYRNAWKWISRLILLSIFVQIQADAAAAIAAAEAEADAKQPK